MNPKRNILLIAILFLIISCERKVEKEPVHIVEEAAEEKGLPSLESRLKFSRYDDDIISNLYKEALKTDQGLGKLDKAIGDINQLKIDSLQAFSKYTETNQRYWTSFERYADQITDSVLKESVLALFEKLQKQYSESLSEHYSQLKNLDKKTDELNDQLIVLKLLVAQKLMEEYQQVMMPDADLIKDQINKYDELIKETQSRNKGLFEK